MKTISNRLYQQLFERPQSTSFNEPVEDSVEYSIAIPDWLSTSWLLDEAKKEYEPYVNLMRNFWRNVEPENLKYEEPPLATGWFRKDTDTWTRVNKIKGEVGYIDFEVNGDVPFCAVLITLQQKTRKVETYYYVARESGIQHVSVGGSLKLLIGHNVVGYDRKFIVEAYEPHTLLRFIDTKAIHKLLFGLGESSQVALWNIEKKKANCAQWARKSSPSDLAAVAKLLLNIELDKTLQSAHLKKWEVIQKEMSAYVKYCHNDCVVGIRVFKELMRHWKEHCPHPFTLFGQIERSTLRLRLDDKYHWQLGGIKKRVQSAIAAFALKLKDSAMKRKNPLVAKFIEGRAVAALKQNVEFSRKAVENLPILKGLLEANKDNPELKKTKPSLKTLKIFEATLKFFAGETCTKEEVKLTENYLSDLTVRTRITPLILEVLWKDSPLQYSKVSPTLGAWMIEGVEGKEILPGADSPRTGNPIGKSHKWQYTLQHLKIGNPDFTWEEVYAQSEFCGLWTAYEKRMVTLVHKDLIWLPDSCPSGTVTGRVTGAACAVLPNPTSNKAGSEMKLLLRPTKGNRIVKADFDGQEVVIASAVSDSTYKYSGSNKFSKEGLEGDYHQLIANLLNMPDQRKLVKNTNFAIIFGGGISRVQSMYIQIAQGKLNIQQALELATRQISVFKGQKEYGVWRNGVASDLFNKLTELAKMTDQRTSIFKRLVPTSLNTRFGANHFNTQANFPIQAVGQELIDILLIGVRVLSKVLGFIYQPMILIHDEVAFDVSPENEQDKKLEHAMQLSHLLSKVMLWKELGIKDFPQSQMWFKSVDNDTLLRKEIAKVLTPTFDSDEFFVDEN